MVNDGKERTHMMIVKFGALFQPLLRKVEENSMKHKCTKCHHCKNNIMTKNVKNLSKKFNTFFSHVS
jgi:hypothetical protein